MPYSVRVSTPISSRMLIGDCPMGSRVPSFGDFYREKLQVCLLAPAVLFCLACLPASAQKNYGAYHSSTSSSASLKSSSSIRTGTPKSTSHALSSPKTTKVDQMPRSVPNVGSGVGHSGKTSSASSQKELARLEHASNKTPRTTTTASAGTDKPFPSRTSDHSRPINFPHGGTKTAQHSSASSSAPGSGTGRTH